VFAICLLTLGLGWYLWGDLVSDGLARLVKGGETRVARSTSASPGPDQAARAPQATVAAAPREPAPPAPSAAPPKQRASQPAPAEPAQAAAEPRASAPPQAKPAPSPAEPPPAKAAPQPPEPPSVKAAPQPPEPPSAKPASQPAEAPPAKAAPQPVEPPRPPASAPPQPAPAESALAATAEPFTLKGFTVFFTQNSTEIPVYANEMLASAAALMKSQPGIAAVIEGHTDSVGDAAYNRLISENRAAAVKNFLVGQGIALSRLSISGFGSDKPIESNDTPQGRSKNRRVVIRLVQGKPG
jgi:outer membrane protein OmpA-like peptidoglycan-associated protein